MKCIGFVDTLSWSKLPSRPGLLLRLHNIMQLYVETNEFISDECVFVATSVCDNRHLLWVLTAIMTPLFFSSPFTINYVIIHFGGGM